MSSSCAECSELLPPDGKFLTCCKCEAGYHPRKSCSAVTESAYSKMTAAKRENWKCQTCRNDSGKQSETVSDRGDDPSSQLSAVNSKLDSLTTTIEALVRTVQDLVDFKTAVQDVASNVQEVKENIGTLSSKYDSVFSTVTTNQTELATLRNEVESLTLTVLSQNEQIGKLTKEMNELEQYNRRCNFEIHGLPVTADENLPAFLDDLARKLKLQGTEKDEILAVHRLPAKRGSIPAILVQTKRVAVKERWFGARKLLATLVQTDFSRLYFNENLTRANRELYHLARLRAKQVGYKFTWTRNGKILCRKSEGESQIRIDTPADLDRIN